MSESKAVPSAEPVAPKCKHEYEEHTSSEPTAAGMHVESYLECTKCGDIAKNDNLTDVYEVYGSAATSRGWDFLVCKTMKDALFNIETSLDSLGNGEEVKIFFRRYTPVQLEDIYEE